MGQVSVAAGGDFASDNGHTRGHQGFAGHVGVGVLCQQGIKNGIGNLVGDLVGVAFSYRFGSEKVFALGVHMNLLGRSRQCGAGFRVATEYCR